MILPSPTKADFDFHEDMRPDTTYEGFTETEMEVLAGRVGADAGGAKGLAFWKKREGPPEIQQLKSQFGYQTIPLLTDLVSVAEAEGTALKGDIKALLPRYNFYILRCGVFIEPDGGEKFEALKFEVRYANSDASTYAMLPAPESRTVLKAGAKADVGVTAGMQFGLSGKVLQAAAANATANATAKADVEANFIVSFSYELKTQVVDALGQGNPFCRWFMHQGDDLRNDVAFYPIIITPKAVTSLDCEFRAYFKIGNATWKRSEFFLKPPKTVTVTA